MSVKTGITPKRSGLLLAVLNQVSFFPVAVLHVMSWLFKMGLLNTVMILTFWLQIVLRVSYALLISLGLFFALLIGLKVCLFHSGISTLEWWAVFRFEGQLALWFFGGLVLDAGIFVIQTTLAFWVLGIGKD